MDARLQLRVQRYGWDRAATKYERYWAEQLQPGHDALLTAAAIVSGDHVLDVACGTGLVTFRAAELVGDTGSVVGTDLSETMLEGARAEAERLGLPTSFARMNAESLEFPDSSYDEVICALGLMYVPDPNQALAEMRRVVRPGGRIVVSVWGARYECGWSAIFPIVESRVLSDVCPLFFQLGGGSALGDALKTAGLTNVETVRVSTTLRYESEQDALGAAFPSGPVALAYSRFGEEQRLSAHAEYLESIATYRDGDGYDIPGVFVIASGDRPLEDQ